MSMCRAMTSRAALCASITSATSPWSAWGLASGRWRWKRWLRRRSDAKDAVELLIHGAHMAARPHAEDKSTHGEDKRDAGQDIMPGGAGRAIGKESGLYFLRDGVGLSASGALLQ